MKRILVILLLLNIGFTQDEYPYFSDPIKQMKFEEKRIYLKEDKGERVTTSTSGGETTSHSELANPMGYLFLDEDPDYVAITETTPIQTHTNIQKWDNFSITQNGIQLSELEFLNVIGLEDRVNDIINEYNKKCNEIIEEYNQKNIKRYKSELEKYERKDEIINSTYLYSSRGLKHLFKSKECSTPEECERLVKQLNSSSPILLLTGVVGMIMLADSYNPVNQQVGLAVLALSFVSLVPWTEREFNGPGWKYPEYRNIYKPTNPSNKQLVYSPYPTTGVAFTEESRERNIDLLDGSYIIRDGNTWQPLLSALQVNNLISRDQIKSLSESYNRKLFQEMTND